MTIKETEFEGLFEIEPEKFTDERGWFFEYFKADRFKKAGLPFEFVQDNQSFSKKGVLRGLHFQRPPHEQAKLVSVISGRVLDVVVDLRKNSSTFGKSFSYLLDGERKNMLLVPEGFAHGFLALEDTVFFYKCTRLYNRNAEVGIRWDDPTLNIQWPKGDYIISKKDLVLPMWDELFGNSVISPL